jgi:hypothetical protein
MRSNNKGLEGLYDEKKNWLEVHNSDHDTRTRRRDTSMSRDVSAPVHAPSRAPLLLPVLLSHNLPLPRVH